LVLYHYKAKTPQGKPMEGTIESSGQREAAHVLRSRGLLVTSLTDNRLMGEDSRRQPQARPSMQVRAAAAAAATVGERKGFGPSRGRIGVRELAMFCRQFATMINAGVAILTSLNILTRQASSRRLRAALAAVSTAIEQGRSLTDSFRAMPDAFPAILVNMASAGEAGGILEECFERLADHFEKEHAVSQKVKSAMTYPVIVSVVAVSVVAFMVVFVLPNFIAIFQQMGAELPGPTLFILGVSDFVRGYWYLLLAGMIGGVAAFSVYSRTPSGAYRIDYFLLRMPIFGEVVLKRSVSRFCRTLGTLLRSGVPLLVSLNVVERTVGNRPVAAAIVAAENEIRAGRGIVEPLKAAKIFPSMVLEMMAVGEETGSIDTMLLKVADFFDKDIDVTVGRLSSMVEPMIIVFVGGLVGFILISLIMPMFDMYGKLSL
jgi:type IV pilus assembly protein PilC